MEPAPCREAATLGPVPQGCGWCWGRTPLPSEALWVLILSHHTELERPCVAAVSTLPHLLIPTDCTQHLTFGFI